ncbi:MAG: cytochrome d ubiquinol oxidase subunit II [Simkaniaceae bacterium]|nr:cytochrome d ubiquinol oxidase subunit II [Simkaniaceae bacterium]
MSLQLLETAWYVVIIIAMTCYAMLDGFDLGVGSLHLFAKKDEYRRIFLNAIGPVWDGNEVWLVIVGGALFAGFPAVYGTVFSVFYVPCMILLAGLIFRACAIEFRSKLESPKWRQLWDVVFCIASIIIAFCVGTVLANLVHGIPLDENGVYHGSFIAFFNLYAMIVGITVVALFMMHGAIYLLMKTEGELHSYLRKWVSRTIGFFIFCYLVTTVFTLLDKGHMIERMLSHPILFIFPILTLVAIVNIPIQVSRGNDGWGFISSCLSMALLFTLFALGTFPNMVRSSIDTEINSLTIHNTASSPLTLKILLLIVFIGIPLVLAYSYYLYRTFRGKVKLDQSSY